MDTATQHKYIEACAEISRLIEGPPEFFLGYFAANAIRNSSHLLYGAPGVGKTTLIRITGKVMFEDETVIVNHYEGVSPEDTIFSIHPGIKSLGNGDSRYTFNPEPMPYLGSRFALMNEMNRAGAAYQNSFLSILEEGQISVRGKTLTKTPGITWIDYNPYKGSFDPAFIDRALSGHTMEELGIAGQIRVANKKYNAGHNPNLVAQAQKMIGFKEMEKVWDDVENVKMSPQALGQAQILLSMFSACKHKLGSMHSLSKKNLNCNSCSAEKKCTVKFLKRPILSRAIDSFVMLSKAVAYVNGRDEVDPDKDFMIALKHTVSHRLMLKDQGAYANNDTWFEKVAVPKMPSKSTVESAKRSMAKIKRALGNDKTLPKALDIYQRMHGKNLSPAIHNLFKEFCLPTLKARILETVRGFREALTNDKMKPYAMECLNFAIMQLESSEWNHVRKLLSYVVNGNKAIVQQLRIKLPTIMPPFSIKLTHEDVIGDVQFGNATFMIAGGDVIDFVTDLTTVIPEAANLIGSNAHDITSILKPSCESANDSLISVNKFEGKQEGKYQFKFNITCGDWDVLKILREWEHKQDTPD